MTVVFLVSLIVGLLLGVRTMMFGVERTADVANGDAISVRTAPAAFAAFTLVFGLLGYVLVNRTRMPTTSGTVIAAAVAILAALGTTWVVTRSARVVPEFDVTDPRYALQGHLAQVVQPITPRGEGEIAYEEGTARHVVRARLLGDEGVDAGADVVIERIEDDVAYVEPWHEVEKRL